LDSVYLITLSAGALGQSIDVRPQVSFAKEEVFYGMTPYRLADYSAEFLVLRN
jgi:hypothetical protein